MIVIDGSYGEGGGQLVRTAVALSALTQQAFTLNNIRARRARPGLAAQHLTAIHAVAQLCHAEVSSLELGSCQLQFVPHIIRGGTYTFDVGTAGSLTLIVQAVLPVTIAAHEPVEITLTGGTDVKAAPPLDYLQYVLLPLLRRMGVKAELMVMTRGYYPRGGGRVKLVVQPSRLQPLRLETAGRLEALRGRIHLSHLPGHIAERMQHTAHKILAAYPQLTIEQQYLSRDQSYGAGGALVLWAELSQTLLGAGMAAERGVPAEQIATSVAQSLLEDLQAGATLDIHAADQILIYLAMVKGTSSFLSRQLSTHAHTTLWLLQQFLPLQVSVATQGLCQRVEINRL